MSRSRIVVTGATGNLGSRLMPAIAQGGEVVGLGFRSAPSSGYQVDLTNADQTTKVLDQVRPDVVVHTAAQADIDECERDPLSAYRLNVTATRHLVDWARQKRRQMAFVYVSTDQVYDKPGGSREDEVAPLNIYSFTKLWAEDLVRRLDRHLILRTNFFGPGNGRRQSFVDWIAASGRERRPITLFSDVYFNPLHIDHLCLLIVELIERQVMGTFNLGASGGGLSKAEFIRAVAAALGLPTGAFRDGRLEDVPLVARRPHDMRMKLEAIEHRLGRTMPSLADGVALLGKPVHEAIR